VIDGNRNGDGPAGQQDRAVSPDDSPSTIDVLRLSGIKKRFNGVQALRGADLALHRNEVLGLLGDNGAGKSTLVKILSGVVRPDEGTMTLRGKNIDLGRFNVSMARKQGIETVHQNRSLAEQQPLWRNLFVGRHRTWPLGFIRAAAEKREAERILREFVGLTAEGLGPHSLVSDLSGGERQGVAIGRAMYFQADVVLLDEPTTALSVREVDRVLGFVRTIKDRGGSCIYVTHSLHHLYEVADRFVLMDRGRTVRSIPRKEINLDELGETLSLLAENGAREGL
jgi:simple sugar transport system ATP-binding protein